MPMLVAALRLVAQQLTTRRIAARLGEMTSLVAAQARDAAERRPREAAERRPRGGRGDAGREEVAGRRASRELAETWPRARRG